jgi:metal-responsive CopG/Arc/MetJ family transcriptional regulator
MPVTTNADRINVILPAEDRALLDALAEHLASNRSAAVRYAVRREVERLGLRREQEGKKKDRKRS